MTKKSPPLLPFSVSTRPAGMSTSSAREAMKASSLSEQLAKRGTERNRSMRASATATGSLAAKGDRDPTNHFVGLFWLVAATASYGRDRRQTAPIRRLLDARRASLGHRSAPARDLLPCRRRGTAYRNAVAGAPRRRSDLRGKPGGIGRRLPPAPRTSSEPILLEAWIEVGSTAESGPFFRTR